MNREEVVNTAKKLSVMQSKGALPSGNISYSHTPKVSSRDKSEIKSEASNERSEVKLNLSLVKDLSK